MQHAPAALGCRLPPPPPAWPVPPLCCDRPRLWLRVHMQRKQQTYRSDLGSLKQQVRSDLVAAQADAEAQRRADLQATPTQHTAAHVAAGTQQHAHGSCPPPTCMIWLAVTAHRRACLWNPLVRPSTQRRWRPGSGWSTSGRRSSGHGPKRTPRRRGALAQPSFRRPRHLYPLPGALTSPAVLV